MFRTRSSGKVEITIRHKLLTRPLYATRDSDGDAKKWADATEKLLRQGILPPEASNQGVGSNSTLRQIIGRYLEHQPVSRTDHRNLGVLLNIEELANKHMSDLTGAWAQAWVTSMKRIDKMKPDTIKHYVGAVARCLDWAKALEVKDGGIPFNPLRELRRNYAQYTPEDLRIAGLRKEAASAQERDRRLEQGEEEKILEAMKDDPEAVLFFKLALETGMRMRELYTVAPKQVDIAKRTIFLDKTKNGSKRQVPLSSVAVELLKNYKPHSKTQMFSFWSGSIEPKDLENDTSKCSQKFAMYFAVAHCDDFRFHDTRHEAICRIFERTTLREAEIMKITGHSSTRMLARYANLRASNLAVSLW
jgi:integrase